MRQNALRPFGARAVRVEQQVLVLFGAEKSRCYRVNTHAWAVFKSEVRGEPFRKILDRSFCGGVSGHTGHWTFGRHRGDVDDGSQSRLGDVAPEDLTRQQCARKIEVHDVLHRVEVNLKKVAFARTAGRRTVPTGGIHQNSDPPELRVNGRPRRLERVAVEHIGPERMHSQTLFCQQAGCFGRALQGTPEQRDARPGTGQGRTKMPSEHAAPARDNGHLAC